MIIGLTGKRHVGKSTIADILVEEGYVRGHAFNGGKFATFAYFLHIGMPYDMAHESVYGALRDTPNDYLPDRETPRFFMERFGQWMGEQLGCSWTLGTELDRIARQDNGRNIVIESVVYEAMSLAARGGKIIRVIRPGHVGPVGIETDFAQASIVADAEIVNDGTKDDLRRKVKAAIDSLR